MTVVQSVLDNRVNRPLEPEHRDRFIYLMDSLTKFDQEDDMASKSQSQDGDDVSEYVWTPKAKCRTAIKIHRLAEVASSKRLLTRYSLSFLENSTMRTKRSRLVTLPMTAAASRKILFKYFLFVSTSQSIFSITFQSEPVLGLLRGTHPCRARVLSCHVNIQYDIFTCEIVLWVFFKPFDNENKDIIRKPTVITEMFT